MFYQNVLLYTIIVIILCICSFFVEAKRNFIFYDKVFIRLCLRLNKYYFPMQYKLSLFR